MLTHQHDFAGQRIKFNLAFSSMIFTDNSNTGKKIFETSTEIVMGMYASCLWAPGTVVSSSKC